MFTRLRNLFERLRSSLWVVPGMLTLGAFLLAQIAIFTDGWTQKEGIKIPFLFPGGLAGARQILGALVTAMVSLTTISFSVMMVVLTLASNQFGPRVLRNFLTDRVNQTALGVFVATFVYALVVLSRLPDSGDNGFQTPRLAVTLAVVLTLGSLATLIYFIHHVARSIQASDIVLRAHQELQRSINVIYPESVGQPSRKPASTAEATPPRPAGHRQTITADRVGYVQAIAADEVMTYAVEHDALVEFKVQPGQFIGCGDPIAEVDLPSGESDDDLPKRGRTWLVIGTERTGEQDVQYGFRQLTEIAVRALSPGINDPTTAVSCIDYIGENLRELSGRDIPSPERADDEGRLRVIAPRDSFTHTAGIVFRNLRCYARGHPEVMSRLVDALGALAPCLREKRGRAWYLETLVSLMAEAKHLGAEEDQIRLREKCESTRDLLPA